MLNSASTGVVIRSSFYLAGVVALGTMGLGAAYGLSYGPRTIGAEPAFRLAAPGLASMPMKDSVMSNGWQGRAETRH